MQAEIHTTEIDDREFQFTPLALKPARKLFLQLTRRFGPALADGVAALDKAGDVNPDQEIEQALGTMAAPLGAAMRQAFLELDPEFYESLTITFGKRCQVKNDEGRWQELDATAAERAFQSKLMSEMRWVWWCLSMQYSDFLAPAQRAMGTAISLKAAANESRFSSPKESIGKSTESPQATDTPSA